MRNLLTIIFFLSIAVSFGQKEESGYLLLGTSIGNKTSIGKWGVHCGYVPNILGKRLEFDFGLGISQSFAFSSGLRIKTLEFKNKFEMHFAFSYGFHPKGEIRYKSETTTDYYDFSSVQYVHPHLINRFWIGETKEAGFQLGIGYTQNISGVNLSHTNGANEHYDRAFKSLESGILIEIGALFRF